MKSQNETDLVKACLDTLKLARVYAWRNQTTGIFDPARKRFRAFHGLAGVSDILGIMPGGKFLAVECKVGKNTPSDDQKVFLASIEAEGGHAVCVWTVGELVTFLKEQGLLT